MDAMSQKKLAPYTGEFEFTVYIQEGRDVLLRLESNFFFVQAE